jgi:hypothetical protein
MNCCSNYVRLPPLFFFPGSGKKESTVTGYSSTFPGRVDSCPGTVDSPVAGFEKFLRVTMYNHHPTYANCAGPVSARAVKLAFHNVINVMSTGERVSAPDDPVDIEWARLCLVEYALAVHFARCIVNESLGHETLQAAEALAGAALRHVTVLRCDSTVPVPEYPQLEDRDQHFRFGAYQRAVMKTAFVATGRVDEARFARSVRENEAGHHDTRIRLVSECLTRALRVENDTDSLVIPDPKTGPVQEDVKFLCEAASVESYSGMIPNPEQTICASLTSLFLTLRSNAEKANRLLCLKLATAALMLNSKSSRTYNHVLDYWQFLTPTFDAPVQCEVRDPEELRLRVQWLVMSALLHPDMPRMDLTDLQDKGVMGPFETQCKRV